MVARMMERRRKAQAGASTEERLGEEKMVEELERKGVMDNPLL